LYAAIHIACVLKFNISPHAVFWVDAVKSLFCTLENITMLFKTAELVSRNAIIISSLVTGALMHMAIPGRNRSAP